MEEFKISGTEYLKNAFIEGRFLTQEEMYNYINHNAKSNGFLNEKPIDVAFNHKTNNTSGASITPERKIIMPINQNIREYLGSDYPDKFRKTSLIKKLQMRFDKWRSQYQDVDKYIKSRNLPKELVNFFNIRLLSSLNHELFHALTFDDFDKISQGKFDVHFDLHTLQSLLKSELFWKTDQTNPVRAYKKFHDLFYFEFLATNYGNKWTEQNIKDLKQFNVTIEPNYMKNFRFYHEMHHWAVITDLAKNTLGDFLNCTSKKLNHDYAEFTHKINTVEGFTNQMYYHHVNINDTRLKDTETQRWVKALRNVQKEIDIRGLTDPRNDMQQAEKLFFGRLDFEKDKRVINLFTRENILQDSNIRHKILYGEDIYETIRKYIDEEQECIIEDKKDDEITAFRVSLDNEQEINTKPKEKNKSKFPSKKVPANN